MTANRERVFKLTRTVDCHEQTWMGPDEVYKEGEVVFEYLGPTYGCLGDGVAVTRERGKTPFIEMPRSALKEVK